MAPIDMDQEMCFKEPDPGQHLFHTEFRSKMWPFERPFSLGRTSLCWSFASGPVLDSWIFGSKGLKTTPGHRARAGLSAPAAAERTFLADLGLDEF